MGDIYYYHCIHQHSRLQVIENFLIKQVKQHKLLDYQLNLHSIHEVKKVGCRSSKYFQSQTGLVGISIEVMSVKIRAKMLLLLEQLKQHYLHFYIAMQHQLGAIFRVMKVRRVIATTNANVVKNRAIEQVIIAVDASDEHENEHHIHFEMIIFAYDILHIIQINFTINFVLLWPKLVVSSLFNIHPIR